MINPDPKCIYVTPEEVNQCIIASNSAVSRKEIAEASRGLNKLSKHNVKIAFSDPDIPLSNTTHGIYKMMPPELLHTTDEGTIY